MTARDAGWTICKLLTAPIQAQKHVGSDSEEKGACVLSHKSYKIRTKLLARCRGLAVAPRRKRRKSGSVAKSMGLNNKLRWVHMAGCRGMLGCVPKGNLVPTNHQLSGLCHVSFRKGTVSERADSKL